MNARIDGPQSPLFSPVKLSKTIQPDTIGSVPGITPQMVEAAKEFPASDSVSWGIPFNYSGILPLAQESVSLPTVPFKSRWIIFLHTSDLRPMHIDEHGMLVPPMRGEGQLNEHAADYILIYEDGSEYRQQIKRRIQVGMFTHRWGDNCFQAVEDAKPHPVKAAHEQVSAGWGGTQTRVSAWNYNAWINWIYALENPNPEKPVVSFRFEPKSGILIISGISIGDASEEPLRWRSRKKAQLILPEGKIFDPQLDEKGRNKSIQLDMGQVISVKPKLIYPQDGWEAGYQQSLPNVSNKEILVEYTAHPDAIFYLEYGKQIPVAEVEKNNNSTIVPIPAANQRVKIKVVEEVSEKPVTVKIHIHGMFGEYLAPVDRHRIINPAWFEDYSADFAHRGFHYNTYIPGETTVDLPVGKVFIEITKGFEIQPIRKIFEVTTATDEIRIAIRKILAWREKGWVTADTHVHFLSPITAMLEGAGEGVNVVNLLASQWGELMTNVGDFDGRNTWGSKESGGDGEYLVRVGTENRQHVLGHISLLGYRGEIIAPMTTGGPDEAAIGDPIEILLTEWAHKCRINGGLVVLPHFPNPRAENAASLINGEIDAVEMTSWGDFYSGIDPYSLADWYRYLNCGYLTAAVGGTDKMSADTAVGTVRTYARIKNDEPFNYETWMQAVRRADTFVTYGPLLDFAVEGKPMGSRIKLPAHGGKITVTWTVASVTIPVTKVELVVNGDIREFSTISELGGSGSWDIKVTGSSWLALLVRGKYPDRDEMIAAHSSPVMVLVEGSTMLVATDAITMLEQIEGALIYLDTIGTRAEENAYKRMRMVLISAYRNLHNRMHQAGFYHDHDLLNTQVDNH